ncbi:MAG: adenosylhomocysteinase [Candidatus Micrarchaeota archaeon]|nr:adenosylhomocysteinase [Candidatus Micrarchaeota archaeon]
MYDVKDIKLAEQGKLQLGWAEMHMPALMVVRSELEKSKPLKGVKVSACLHVTKETGVLMRTLKAAGAIVSIAAANPLSTQDDVAAALASEGINIFAWKDETQKEYDENIEKALKNGPQVIMDDGSDLHATLHKRKKDPRIIGGTEETTTGVIRLRAMEKEKVLRYPVVAVNNASTKYLFDNRYGTGQSTVDGVIRATNIFIPGKVVVVAGYGWVGRGVAMRFHGMGARIVVTEVDPFKALEAVHDSFEVMKMEQAAKVGDIFVTATGDLNVIRVEHMRSMKDGAIVSNTGHFDVEIDVTGLRKIAKEPKRIREHMQEYKMPNGNRIYLLAEGRIVNLGAAEGHPSEVMDLSFCNQVLSALYVYENRKDLQNKVYGIPKEIDERIAYLKLKSMNIGIDKLTQEQKDYLSQWSHGT